MNSPTNKLLIVSTLIFLISGGSALFVLYRQEAKGATMLLEMVSVRDQEELKRHQSVLEEEWRETTAERERLQSFVVAGEKGTIDFLARLDELAGREGVSISTTELKVEATAAKGFDDLVGSFTLRGGGRAMERVLRQFELLPYDARIDSLKLTRAGEASEATVVLRVSTFE